MLYKCVASAKAGIGLTPKTICINFAFFVVIGNISILLIVFSLWWEDRKLVPGGWIWYPLKNVVVMSLLNYPHRMI